MSKVKRIEIGKRLKKAREHCGLSQEELSLIVREYSAEEILEFEEGKRELDVDAFASLCFALKTDMEWMLNGVSSKERYGVESDYASYYGNDVPDPIKH